MELNSVKNNSYVRFAIDAVYGTYINCYLRETQAWGKVFHTPKYDEPLALHMRSIHHDKLIKIRLEHLDKEVFCPLEYFSFTGRHKFSFPVVVREVGSEGFAEVSLEEFSRLTSENYLLQNEIESRDGMNVLLGRLHNSVENTAKFIRHRQMESGDIDDIFADTVSFIDAEQSLLLGHAMHPVAKSRIGFDDAQLVDYSPETKSKFQLHYFLVSADLIWEKHLDTCLSSTLKDQFMQEPHMDAETQARIADSDHWKVLPCHPWQAKHMLKQAVIQELIDNKLIFSLGECGSLYTATSSIRTLYSDESDYMLKFSLNVQITNSERVNLPKELMRGYEFAKLMRTEFGETLGEQYPRFQAVTDPGFMAVRYKGKVIDGFSTVVRNNPFKSMPEKNISLLAAWCQDPILPYQQNRIVKTIIDIAKNEKRAVNNVALDWFERYLQISLIPLVKMYNTHGLFLEGHGQNCLLEVDGNGYPAIFYFRDNQGYFFREGGEHYAKQLLPELGDESLCIADVSFLNPKFTYYFVINNIITVINSIGRARLVEETHLVGMMSEALQALLPGDKTGWVSYMIQSRDLEVKANLLTRLHDYDELMRPLETHAVYVDYPNPFLVTHFSKALMSPEGLGSVFSKQDNGMKFSLRPLDLDKDMAMLHAWYHREHTIPYWAMNISLKALEAFYINLDASDYSHAFIGEIDGQAAFVTEYYWSMRDPVSRYYDAKPADYGMHICIAAENREQRHSMAVIRTILDYLFAQPEVWRCVGESHRDSKAALGLFKKVGYEFQRVIDMPHKSANLTFLSRENYKQSETKLVGAC
ncbi:MAG: GNAT family N-acetyltransferase [Thiotrichaceae bacterium]|nr:GNAT family N-acetyltransferase [Thiotrichaceae bacterium]